MKRPHAATLVLLAVALTTTLVADPPVRVDIDVDPTRQPEQEKVERIEAKAPPAAVVEGMNAFGFDLYDRLADAKGAQGKNLFYSPTSIATALTMTYAGARGNTATQMAEVLHLPKENVHEGYGAFVGYINEVGKAEQFDLTLANALWGQHDYDFLDPFTGLLNEKYEAGLRLVDFRDDVEGARQTINTWVEDRTNDKIEELLKRPDLAPDARLVLTNAIYFNGAWEHTFDPDRTREMPFTTAGGKKVDTPTMYQKKWRRYAETDTAQCIELAYKDSDMAMMVLLPKKADGLEALEKGLDTKTIAGWVDKLKKREVRLYLPKFKMTCRYELKPVLRSMGMTDAFVFGKADFSGMDGTRLLYIGAVIHQAFVDVNETGTEAAAATAVVMRMGAARRPTPVFKADHPFVFLIRDTKTGAV